MPDVVPKMPTLPAPQTEPVLGEGIYRHSSRHEWGLAMRDAVVKEGIWYLFQDGTRRKIAATHSSLMVEVDCTGSENERVLQALLASRGRVQSDASARVSEPLVSLDQQVRLFLEDFPDGFADASYVKAHRGNPGKRAAQRHRDPAVTQARELLSRPEMESLIAANQTAEVIARVRKLLAATSLVTKPQLVPLETLDWRGVNLAARALFDLLHTDVDTAEGMQAWIDALVTARRGISWSLVTAAPALVQPATHTYVQASVYTNQARSMAPRLRLDRSPPRGDGYVRLNTMVSRLVEQLEARGLTPRDRLDAYDFMWLTLHPAALRRIAEMSDPPPPIGDVHPADLS